MFPLSTVFSVFVSQDSDKQRQKESDASRAAQVLRLRMEEQSKIRQEEERKRIGSDTVRARVRDLLKQADQHFKNHDLAEARKTVVQAKELEPANLYVRAFEERLVHLEAQTPVHQSDIIYGEQTMTSEATVSKPSSAETQRIAAKVIFRRVDQFIAARDTESAKKEFRRACELDPFNLSIAGYQQRIDALERERGREARQEENRMQMHEQKNHRESQLPRKKEGAEKAPSRPVDNRDDRSTLDGILDQVGKLVNAKLWDRALEEVQRGKTLLPGNKDLSAMEERLVFLKDEDERSRNIEETRKRLSEPPVRKVLTEAREQLNSIAEAKSSGITRLMRHIEELVRIKAWGEALQEVERAKQIDPQNTSVQTFEVLISLLKKEEEQYREEFFTDPQTGTNDKKPDPLFRGAEEPIASPHEQRKEEGSVQAYHRGVVNNLWHRAYARCLRKAWGDGIMSSEEQDLLAILRDSFAINDAAHARMELEAQWEVYLEAMVDAWRNGAITPTDSEQLDLLRERLRISAEVHLKLERKIRQNILKRGRQAFGEIKHDFEPLFREQVLGKDIHE